jgi:anti-sigma factor RsiW
MADPGQLALIHAEIDGELDASQRAELARTLLADPQARALRDDLRRFCQSLDALEPLEPPADLKDSILAAMPQLKPRRRWSSAPVWRYAAMVAGVLIAGTVVFEILRGPGTAPSEVAGTIALAPAATLVDTAEVGNGPVSGRVSLYRDRAILALGFDVRAALGVSAQVRSGGHVLRIDNVGQGSPAGAQTTVALPGVPMNGQSVEVTFLAADRAVGTATLRAPHGP